MPNLASIYLIGHLGRDPEQRAVGQKQVVSFSVAHTRKRGEKETTTWYDVSVWSEKTGAAVMEYAKKGHAILVHGDVYQDTYQAKDGTTKTTLRVDANQVTFIQGKMDGERTKDKVAQVAQAAAAGTDEPPF